MIVDTMSKYEVMSILRKEFDEEVYRYYQKKSLALINQYRTKCERNKNFSTNYEENYTTSSYNRFNIYIKINHKGLAPSFTYTFKWKEKTCFAHFFQDETVVIYQSHSLERYAERVLNCSMKPEEVFKRHIIKHEEAAFRIVLPTPTHKHSYYVGIADALFLGDFDAEHPIENYIWLNTCISYNETKFSQYRITQSLHMLQEFIKKAGSDLSKEKNNKQLREYIKNNESHLHKMEDLKTFLIYNHLFLQLHLYYKFDFTEKLRDDINTTMQYIESQLNRFGINPNMYSPFDPPYEIAHEEELKFRNNL